MRAQVVSFGTEFEKEEISETSASLMDRIEKTLDHLEKYEKIKPCTKIISDIDMKLDAPENESSILLYIRNFAMKGTSQIIETFKNSDTRRILYHALDIHNNDVKNISESLNLREAVV